MEKRIIILEDDTDLLNVLTIMLESRGFQVIPLSELKTIEELILCSPDCIVLDEKLPYIQGHTICIMIKTLFKNEHIPVILMSGNDNIESTAQLCEADGFIQKPFLSNDHFISMISTLIN